MCQTPGERPGYNDSKYLIGGPSITLLYETTQNVPNTWRKAWIQ